MTDRPKPKIVHQMLPTVCFAAALESWLDACSKERFRTQYQPILRKIPSVLPGCKLRVLWDVTRATPLRTCLQFVLALI
jgi:hypothetical protein